MISRKGQGLSLNVIIVAALALVVLVVLIVVFTGRVQIFEKGVSEEGKAELVKMKIFYGKCHPTGSFEDTFIDQFGAAETPEEKDEAESNFRYEIDRCKDFSADKETCEGATGCVWS